MSTIDREQAMALNPLVGLHARDTCDIAAAVTQVLGLAAQADPEVAAQLWRLTDVVAAALRYEAEVAP